jgi:hypothetical protein
MKVASITAAAISQGLKLGVHFSVPLLITIQEIIFHFSFFISHSLFVANGYSQSDQTVKQNTHLGPVLSKSSNDQMKNDK